MSITKKQKEILDYVISYTQEYGYSPTQKEIKEHFGFKSFGSVQRYIKYLTNDGYLQTDWNARRGLKVVQNGDNKVPSHLENQKQTSIDESSVIIPLLGNVAAGIPIEAIENPDDTVSIPRNMITGRHRYYALKIKGESMIEDGIFENDLIICRHQEEAKNGETVVAVIDGEATVKKFHQKKNMIELHPANSTMSPILINRSSGQFNIAGVVVGLFRYF
ncbi:MAG: transcriptional repressor LexA [Bacteriovoracaceae bacterium]|mgnify:CR=1 FL=1|jgi:repressor LexA|nr:transcriptional repressor LexA [Bacteriovoracaceae bacterium]